MKICCEKAERVSYKGRQNCAQKKQDYEHGKSVTESGEKKKTTLTAAFDKYKKTYASLIALAGHSEAHVPQLTHFDASISRCPSFSEIAPTGQSGSQVPQFTHTLGSIFIAIIVTSR